MKFLKKFIKWLAIILGLLILTLYITDTDYLIKAVRTVYLKGHTTAYIKIPTNLTIELLKTEHQNLGQITKTTMP